MIRKKDQVCLHWNYQFIQNRYRTWEDKYLISSNSLMYRRRLAVKCARNHQLPWYTAIIGWKKLRSYPIDNSVRFSPSILLRHSLICPANFFDKPQLFGLWFIGNFDLTIERVARLCNQSFYIFLLFFALLFFNRRNLIKNIYLQELLLLLL